ncbi:hypothetical protein F0562_021993 [Nyssa sinensis]|uniref:GAF domain-containing protein n=1 Tax=Nyssa sinensis TaxID=561372 RepID=A0A5J5BNX0_9ASTE|nr:hypothetical protein F0562_021993 [Nyssa sinensis]
MVREGLLMKKTRELGEEIGLIKRQEEASWLVLMLSHKIRKSLDRHTILYTCMAELSRVLLLENCAIWLPNESNSVMVLSHELKTRDGSVSIPVDDSEMAEILAGNGVRVLGLYSRLGMATGNGNEAAAAAAAIPLPMLRVSNFGDGKAEEAVESGYALLVLVLPEEGNRVWRSQELEIVKGVADQVAVALSHAAILEESLLVREKLMEQNVALHRAREVAMMADEAIRSYQSLISKEMTRPNRSIAAILRLRVPRRYCALSEALILNLMFAGRCRGRVIGDETRILQAVLCMVGKVSGYGESGSGTVVLCVYVENGSQGSSDPNYLTWKRYVYEGSVLLKFDVRRVKSREDCSSFIQRDWEKCTLEKPGINFSLCEKLAKLMHGSASTGHNSEDLDGTMNFTIRLPIQHSQRGLIQTRCMDPENPRCLLKGMKTILADSDGFNRSITRKLLENLGCHLTIVSSRLPMFRNSTIKRKLLSSITDRPGHC